MKLQHRFQSVLGFLSLLLFLIVLANSYHHARSEAIAAAYRQCHEILSDATALQSYVSQTLRPIMAGLVGPDGFIPEAMSSTYVSRNLLERNLSLHPGYRFKFAAIDPRNEKNTPSETERRVIGVFQQDPSLSEWQGQVEQNGETSLMVATPIRFLDGCLRCHSTPDIAPKALLERYGATRGFGRQIGDVAIRTAMVPIRDVNRIAVHHAWATLWPYALVLGLLYAGSNLFFSRMIGRPIRAIETAATAITNGSFDVRLPVDRDDEFGRMGATFNLVADRLIEEIHSRDAHLAEITRGRDEWLKTFDAVPDLMTIVSTEFRILRANRAMAETFGMEAAQMIGQPCHHIFHGAAAPPDHCPLARVLQTGQPVSSEFYEPQVGRHLLVTASPVWDETGQMVSIIEVGRDVTDRLRLEEEGRQLQTRLFQQQKAHSIATLAGGIAHDFNNILMSVMGFAELLDLMSTSTKSREFARAILQGTERMAHLTRQLLAYAEGGKYVPVVLNFNEIAQEALALAKKGKAVAIEAELSLDGELWPIHADRSQMLQMVINLLNNAFEAVEEKGGRIRVATANRSFGQAWPCEQGVILPAGDFVQISVSDSGSGVPKKDLERIFEPFYSTKFLGRGLGLAAVSGIVQNHGGGVRVESSDLGGAIFHVYLPKWLEASKAESPATQAMDGRAALSPHPKEILLVDDEPHILQVVGEFLAPLGYAVRTAADGAESLRLLKEHLGEVAMVILDIMMPGMNGRDVYREIKRLNPSVWVIVASGYDQESALQGMSLEEGDLFMQKPYNLGDLAALIERRLAR